MQTESDAELPSGADGHLQLSEAEAKDLARRLARIEGQVRGLGRMIEERRDCNEVVTHFQAAMKALERVGFSMVAAQLFACAKREGPTAGADFERLQGLFLKLK